LLLLVVSFTSSWLSTSPGTRDPIRDFTNETFYFGGLDRPAQGDPAIGGGGAEDNLKFPFHIFVFSFCWCSLLSQTRATYQFPVKACSTPSRSLFADAVCSD
jgi:hypothetical protein